MKAVKGNKEYTVGEAQMKAYQDAGYDIVDGAGEVIAHGRNKTVPYGEYAALEKENGRLKAENAELRKKAPADADKKEGAKKGAGKAGG